MEKRKQKKEKAKVFLLREDNQNHESEPQWQQTESFSSWQVLWICIHFLVSVLSEQIENL